MKRILMADVRRIDDLGRVSIPKRIREALKITEGDMLDIILYPSGVYIKRIAGKRIQGKHIGEAET